MSTRETSYRTLAEGCQAYLAAVGAAATETPPAAAEAPPAAAEAPPAAPAPEPTPAPGAAVRCVYSDAGRRTIG
jgi:hypothetical protein